MDTRGLTSNQSQNPGQIMNRDPQAEVAIQTAVELVKTKKRLGLTLTIYDKNLNKISGKFDNMADLMRNPEFISKLDQELYVSDGRNTTWFKLTIKKGNLVAIKFLLTIYINWVKIYNYASRGFDVLLVSYSPIAGDDRVMNRKLAAIPWNNFTPERITEHFKGVTGETANEKKEIGKLICYILSQYTLNPAPDMLDYIGKVQGFSMISMNNNNTMRFSPPSCLKDVILPYLSKKVLNRHYPGKTRWEESKDWTPTLSPLFKGKKKLQLLLLYRLESWYSSFFAKKAVISDNILQVKPSSEVPVAMLVALLKNTRYDSLDAPQIGPNIKPLKFDLETVNDGTVVAIDVFAADQLKKAEKGYDMLINDTSGAAGESETAYHNLALISSYADLYIPKEFLCVIDLEGESAEYSVAMYRNSLKNFDSGVIQRTEYECDKKRFIDTFNNYVNELQKNIPDSIPRSKHNTYIRLMTALRMYNEWYSPLFSPDIEQYIVNWLSSQEQDIQPL